MNLRRNQPRRGALLLLVLSMLSLFLLLGTTFLVLATRARTAARAFMDATSDVESSPALPKALLDEALLMLVRGSLDPALGDVMPESILGDVYGTDDNRVAFRDEPFDSFSKDPDDPAGKRFDPWLSSDTVAAYDDQTPAPPRNVDNDADGENDGVWLDKLFPAMTSTKGGRLSFKVSYLVRDLDGRINVNAHGGTEDQPDAVGPAAIDIQELTPIGTTGEKLILHGQGLPPARGPKPSAPNIGDNFVSRGATDPYQLKLDDPMERKGSLTQANLFGLGELERVLRPFDCDWSTLPPRLAAVLTDLSGTARYCVTTDSWDRTNRKGVLASEARRLDLNTCSADELRQLVVDAKQRCPSAAAIPDSTIDQWVANVIDFRDPDGNATSLNGASGADPKVQHLATWDVGRFVSVAELLAVPAQSRQQIEAADPLALDGLSSLLTADDALARAILEAVEVRSPFINLTTNDREPGRINVNTCPADVRETLVLPNLSAAQSVWDVIKEDQTLLFLRTFQNPATAEAARDKANRLASISTVRSNVFAVWITLQMTDSAPDAGPPTCHRLFAIVDRSIPVLYRKGQNTDGVHNVIRLKRFLN